VFLYFLDEHWKNPRAHELKFGPRIQPKGFILIGSGWKNWVRIEESSVRPSIPPQKRCLHLCRIAYLNGFRCFTLDCQWGPGWLVMGPHSATARATVACCTNCEAIATLRAIWRGVTGRGGPCPFLWNKTLACWVPPCQGGNVRALEQPLFRGGNPVRSSGAACSHYWRARCQVCIPLE